MSHSTKIDLLITNMIIFNQLNASFPVKMVEISKLPSCRTPCAASYARKVGGRLACGTIGTIAGLSDLNKKTLGSHHGSLFVLFIRGTLLVAILL